MRFGWPTVVEQRAELGIGDPYLIVVDHVDCNVNQPARAAGADQVVGACGDNRARDVIGNRDCGSLEVSGYYRVLQRERSQANQDINAAAGAAARIIFVRSIVGHGDAGERGCAAGAVVVDSPTIVIGSVAADSAVR